MVFGKTKMTINREFFTDYPNSCTLMRNKEIKKEKKDRHLYYIS